MMKYVAVHAFFINKNRKLLLLKRKNTGYMDGFYGIPAGHVEPRELLTDAMRREVQEEIGLDLKVTLDELSHVMLRIREDREYIDFFFYFKHWKGVISNKETTKCERLIWGNSHHLPEKIIPYIGFAWENIQQHKPFSQAFETMGQFKGITRL